MHGPGAPRSEKEATRSLLIELEKPGLTSEAAAKVLQAFSWVVECKRDRSGDRRWCFKPPEGWDKMRNRTKFRGQTERSDTILGVVAYLKRNLFIECFKQFLLLAEGISLHNDDLERKLRSGLS